MRILDSEIDQLAGAAEANGASAGIDRHRGAVGGVTGLRGAVTGQRRAVDGAAL